MIASWKFHLLLVTKLACFVFLYGSLASSDKNILFRPMAFCPRSVRLCFFFSKMFDVVEGLISLSPRVFAYDDRILLGIRSRKVQRILTRFSRNCFPILIQTRLNKHFRRLTIKPTRIQNLRQPIKEKKERKKERRANQRNNYAFSLLLFVNYIDIHAAFNRYETHF